MNGEGNREGCVELERIVNVWLKREAAMAGRSRILASVFLFWGPIFLTVIFLLVIWLVQFAGN